jgi:hypothetical protein
VDERAVRGECSSCRHYEPFSVYWQGEKWNWIDELETPEGERAGLEEFDEIARHHAEEHWKTRRWGRCTLSATLGGSLIHPVSRSGAIDHDEGLGLADLRCSPFYGCNQWKGREE